jgi:glycosyltransferase involved in cell wall biosynthesis
MTLPNESPIRIMRIIARMNVGGPAVQVTGLMRGINPTYFDQRLYTGYCDKNESDYLESSAPDVEVIRIPGLGRRVNLVGDFRALILLVKEMREFKPDIIHTHTAKAGFLGRLASLISTNRAMRVHTFHGHLLHGYFGRFKLSLIINAERILGIFTHQLLAVGVRVRQDLLDVRIGTPEKFVVMPPGVSIRELPSKSQSKVDFGLQDGILICALIGRVTQIKRPDRFLALVAELKKRDVKLHFFIAGDGELLKNCFEKITQEDLPVKILGWQSNIEKLLSAADIVVLTSDNEGTPLSLIQAGMAGLPVVSTNVGSVSEVIIDGDTGFLTSLDIHEMASALEKLVANENLRLNLGTKAKEFTVSHFGLNRLVHDHEELYVKMLSNRAKS